MHVMFATATGFATLSAVRQTPFIADHPFFFVLAMKVGEERILPIILGRVVKP